MGTTPTIHKLGILAGQGALPAQLVDHCQARDIPCFTLAFSESLNPAAPPKGEHAVVSLGQIGQGLQIIRQAGVTELVMAGHIKRPSLRKLEMDDVAKRLLKKLGMKLLGGDDALLRALIEFLEGEGFTMLAAHDILGGMTLEPGMLTSKKPDEEHLQSAQKALKILHHMAPLDVGQSLVIEDSYTLGIEAAEGTDALIIRCKDYMKAEQRALLVKAKKQQQDERADMPTIGVQTIENLADHGYAGVVIEAHNVLVIDREQVIRTADSRGLFVVAI